MKIAYVRYHASRRHPRRVRLFSAEDKLLIAQKLDELGIDYIEGGWPGSNPKDKAFFERARDLRLTHAKLTAFGSAFARQLIREHSDPLRWNFSRARVEPKAVSLACVRRGRSRAPLEETLCLWDSEPPGQPPSM